MGTNIKYLAESLSNNGSNGFALDLGLITRPAAFFSVGAKFENLLATPMKWNTVSGTEDKIGPLIRVGISVVPIVDKLTLNGDFSVRENSGAEVLTGAEYDLFDSLSLRGGMFSGRPTFGLGLNYNDLVIDYSYVKGTEILEDSHRVSLSFTFGGTTPDLASK